MSSYPLALIEAPSNLGLAPPTPGREPGVRNMARVLRELGLRSRLGAVDGGEVVPPRYGAERDDATGIRNAREIADYSRALARAVGSQLDAGRFPIVIGGDCSILLGSLLALYRRGRYGLVFLDGHHDLQTPAVSRTGGAAGMDLALAVGIGPTVLTALGGADPLVRASDVALLAVRDDPAWYTGDDVERARRAMHVCMLDDVRRVGPSVVGAGVVDWMSRSNTTGAWVHVDVDVLDDAVMPAVDSRQPDGLSYDELAALLRPMLDARRIVGMQFTIYDPERDPDYKAGRQLVDGIVSLFR
jgi:arginase